MRSERRSPGRREIVRAGFEGDACVAPTRRIPNRGRVGDLLVMTAGVLAVGTPGLGPRSLLSSVQRPASSVQFRITERPLPFGPRRQALTLEYVRAHYDPAATSIRVTPRMIVIHATETASLDSTLRIFWPDSLPAFRSDIARGGAVNVSSQYLVDRDGTIYHLVSDTLMARHVIGLNRIAIGIENVGGGPYPPLTEQQLDADRWLVQYLTERYPSIRYLIGHCEYGRFRHTPLWEERDSTYITPKTDPGADFMARLRQALARSDLAERYDARAASSAP